MSARERFLAGEPAGVVVEVPGAGWGGAVVRRPILASWARCQEQGLAPGDADLPYLPDLESEEQLLRAAAPVLDRLHGVLSDTKVSLVLTDGRARVVSRRAGEPGLNRHLDAIQLAEGFSFSESNAGTNGIGTALAEGRPFVVFAGEHFADRFVGFACAGVPIRDPFSGRIRGIIDLTSWQKDASPLMAALAAEAASNIESRLLEQYSERERMLFARFRDGELRPPPRASQRTACEAATATAARAMYPGRRPPELSGGMAGSMSGGTRNGDHAGNHATTHVGKRTGDHAGNVDGDHDEAVMNMPHLEPPTGASVERQTPVERQASAEKQTPVERQTPVEYHEHQAPLDLQRTPPPTPFPPPLLPQLGQGEQFEPAGKRDPFGRGGSGQRDQRDALTPRDPRGALSPLNPADRDRVAARAAELVAAARRDIVEVPLSRGRSATLQARPTRGPEGAEVVTVEASVQTAALGFAGPVVRQAPPELVLVGEQAVGRIAVEARQRLAMLLDASGRIGTTLDMESTAQELADMALPDFAQHVTVDLAAWVLDGEESAPPSGPVRFRRSAVRTTQAAKVLKPIGAHLTFTPGMAQSRCLADHRPILDEALTEATADKRWVADDPKTSVIAAPIISQGTVLGVASFYRFGDSDPFDEDDINLAGELAFRAAVCLDNARRYERERATALALQRSLLPQVFAAQCAVDVAQCYLPAQEGVGGDWYDVIPLSGGRVALVVGDVVGHGIHAAATMGRLRTAVRNFSALDLPPEDLLGQLDALVDSLDQDEAEDRRGVGIIGATCLYVIYDPVSGQCALAAAGHPSPAVVTPDGAVAFLDVPTGPPLGLGGTSFEAIELTLSEGSTLVLYTDGLVENRDQDIVIGQERLGVALAGPGRAPAELCETAISELLPSRPWDDVALLVARTRRTDADKVASWEVPLSPSAVGGIRAEVTRQLRAWGLEDAVPTTALVVSELVTNAIRHATGPVELRILRDRALICEVADGSSVSPRLRRAQTTDEGGRGLFLVAQLSQRWGTRYTARGKVIWSEQPLPVRSGT